MNARVASRAADIAGGTWLELAAIGGLVGTTLVIASHFSHGMVSGLAAALTSFLFGHIFGRLGTRTLREAAFRGAVIGLGMVTFGLAASLLLGAPVALINSLAIASIAAPIGALFARATHGF
jgi:hypothetical protein